MNSRSVRLYAVISAIVCVALLVCIFFRSSPSKIGFGVTEGIHFSSATSATSTVLLGTERYSSNTYPISFVLPESFTVRTVVDDSGTALVVADQEQKNGFQIYIQPFDEPNAVITAERIKRDIPDMQLTDVQNVTVSETQGVAFISRDTKMREVWFVYRGFLYQIMSAQDQENLLQQVLATWQFRL